MSRPPLPVEGEVVERLRVLAGQVDPRGVERLQRGDPVGDRGREGLAQERAEGDVLPGLHVAGRPVVEPDHAEDVVGEPGDRDPVALRGRGADHEAELGLDVEAGARAERGSGVGGRLALPVRPDDRGARRDHGAGAAVVADREVLPVRQQRLLVRPEDLAHVGGVRLGGVEVDVVADLERHPQRHLGQRHQVRLDVLAARRVAQQGGDPAPYGRPRVAALRHQRVERGRREDRCQVQLVRGRDRCQVEHQVADPHADPGGVVPADEHAVRQVVDVVRRSGSAVDPGARVGGHVGGGHTSSSSPVLMSSSRGSVTEQEPNEVNQRRPPESSVSKASPTRAPLSCCSRIPTTSSREAPSKACRVATRTLRKPWCSKPVAASRWRSAPCSPAVHLNGVSRSRAASIQAASAGADGKACASVPPVRNFSRSSAAAISSAAASQPAVGSQSVLRQLDVDGHVVAQLAAHLVDRGDHAPGVAGEVVGVAQRDLDAGDLEAEALREPHRSGDLTGAAGHHHGQRAAEPADQRQVGVAEHERPDEAGVPLLAPGGERRGRLVQRGVAGREDGGVVDEAQPGRDRGQMASTSSRGYSSHEAHCGR